ncbi:MAG: hypothetical protein ACI3XQ_01530, partial [Eubacteriales bacterium]
MKKITVLCLSVIMIISALAGCNKTRDPQELPTPTDTDTTEIDETKKEDENGDMSIDFAWKDTQ